MENHPEYLLNSKNAVRTIVRKTRIFRCGVWEGIPRQVSPEWGTRRLQRRVCADHATLLKHLPKESGRHPNAKILQDDPATCAGRRHCETDLLLGKQQLGVRFDRIAIIRTFSPESPDLDADTAGSFKCWMRAERHVRSLAGNDALGAVQIPRGAWTPPPGAVPRTWPGSLLRYTWKDREKIRRMVRTLLAGCPEICGSDRNRNFRQYTQ